MIESGNGMPTARPSLASVIPKEGIKIDLVKNQKITGQIQLSDLDIDEIERKVNEQKETWIKKANESGKDWITERITLSPEKKIKVLIYNDKRPDLLTTGHIDLVFQQLGAGKFGTVYALLHYETLRFGRARKKEYSVDLLRTPDQKDKMFEDEIAIQRKIALIESDHLAKGWVSTKGRKPKESPSSEKLSITMEQFKGDIAEKEYGWIDAKYTKQQIGQIARDVLNGLAALHEKGIIHFDIKPDNILENDKGRFSIGDFGLATDAKDTEVSRGSLGFKSPECLAPEKFINPAYGPTIDLFALGITLLGKYPKWFSGRNTVIKSKVHLHPMQENEPDRNTFEWFIWKLCHPNPAPGFRFSTAEEALQELDRVAQGLGYTLEP